MSTSEKDLAKSGAIRGLLAGAIDYAGLFPPSGLSMPEAVINYATYKNSNYAWMLGSFVTGAGRLTEFYETARDFISRDGTRTWRVSAIAGDDIYDAIRKVDEFNTTSGPGVVCDTIEARAMTEHEIQNASASLPAGVTAFFEIAPTPGFTDLIAAVAVAGQRAKIRTGGITPEAFPTSEAIVRFVQACSAANVPFKATAGLHHPIKCFRPLTYEADSVQGTMHGFLNLFLMTGFCREGYRRSFLQDVMEEEFEEVFAISETGILWRNEFPLSLAQVLGLRQFGIMSFGSCSFEEPIADLQSLGIL